MKSGHIKSITLNGVSFPITNDSICKTTDILADVDCKKITCALCGKMRSFNLSKKILAKKINETEYIDSIICNKCYKRILREYEANK